MKPNKVFDYHESITIAENIMGKLTPFCSRLELAGNLRTGQAPFNEISLVALPKLKVKSIDLWRNVTYDLGAISELERFLDKRLEGKYLSRSNSYRSWWHGGIKVHFWTPEPKSFGYVQLRETCQPGFMELMRKRIEGKGLMVIGNHLSRGGIQVPLPREEDLFNALEMEFIPPEERSVMRLMGNLDNSNK